MQKTPVIACLLVDIGGVLLTDGWDRHSRQSGAVHFGLDLAEMEDRHGKTWDTHQLGKMTLAEYLDLVVFYKKQSFTKAEFQRFMFDRSKPYTDMINLVTQLKARYGLKVGVLSNEGRELNSYRIRKFKLGRFVDFFVSSCYVRLLKPDVDIFRLALDIAQTPASQVAFIENTAMFVEIADRLGVRGILHTDTASTREKLGALGLHKDGPVHASR
ncbi:HAD family hydrolase [Cypionkella psychrotolerans]|uniref:HAD family hydrolase n=1 Tax=Cypionkella psychrotolerans TaxID=1678131 RepID=UPI0006B59A30|nr:HAD family hydrolase [Cypionkella psychrotolerans]